MAVTEQGHAAGAVLTLAVRACSGLELLAPGGFVAVVEHVIDVDQRHHAEVGFGVEVRHIIRLGVVAGADLQTGVDLHVRRAVDALTAGEQGFDSVVTVAEVRRAHRQAPFAAFVGAPADETAAAVGLDVAVERAQWCLSREVFEAAAVLPMVVDVAGDRQPRALFVAETVIVIGHFGFKGHVTSAAFQANTLKAVVTGAFGEVAGGITDPGEHAPVFIDGRAVQGGLDTEIAAAADSTGITAATTVGLAAVGFDAQLGHVVHFALTGQTLYLAVIRITGDDVVGQRIHLPPFL
ncbi:hypothetical protein D3C81_1374520 [compost metagenome]